MGIAGALPQLQLMLPDLPGYGKTGALAGPHNLATYSSWLRDLVARIGGVDLLVGHSFGSLVVSRAISEGLTPGATVLLNPITTRSSEQAGLANRIADSYYRLGSSRPEILRSQAVVRAMSVTLARTKNPALRRFIHGQHSSHFSTYAETRVVTEGYAAARSASVLDYAESLSGKLLVVAGERDLVAPLENQLRLAQLTNAELRVIPKVGHLTHYECPATVAEHIAEFLD